MRSPIAFALGAILGLAPVAGGATEKAPVVRSVLPRRFEVRPPKGFRPSETPLMLSDTLASTRNGQWMPHPLLYPRMSDDRTVIAVHSELLSSKVPSERGGLSHVFGFAKSYGFTIVADDATPAQRSALADALKPYGVDHLVVR